MNEKSYLNELKESAYWKKQNKKLDKQEKIKEAADQTAIDISKSAANQGNKVYAEKIKQCKKRGTSNPQVCMWKALRSSSRQSISVLKDRAHKCASSDNPSSCRAGLKGLIKLYQQRIDQLSTHIENAE